MCCSPCGRYARVAIKVLLGCRRTARRDGQLEEPHRYGSACRGSNKGEKHAAAGRLKDEAENEAANESTRDTQQDVGDDEAAGAQGAAREPSGECSEDDKRPQPAPAKALASAGNPVSMPAPISV